FVSSRRRHTRFSRDWSSDVCSSDLGIWWERLQGYRKLADRIELGKWMEPAETAETYGGAKIVINMHRAPDDSTFNNNTQGIGARSEERRVGNDSTSM